MVLKHQSYNMKNIGENGNSKNEFRLIPDLKENPFIVPENYFSILQKEIILNSKLIKLSDSVFSEPVGYQAQLTNDILARVSEEKLKTTVSVDGFSVPEDYFTKIKEEIAQKATAQPKIVLFRKSRIAWMPYVAAACLTIVVSIVTFFYTTNSNENVRAKEAITIDALPTEDIINYLSFYSETGDLIALSDQLSGKSINLPNSFSSEEIELYLENSI